MYFNLCLEQRTILNYLLAFLNIHVFRAPKKVKSGCPKQVDFPAGQVAFHFHLANGEGIRKVVFN